MTYIQLWQWVAMVAMLRSFHVTFCLNATIVVHIISSTYKHTRMFIYLRIKLRCPFILIQDDRNMNNNRFCK